MERHETPIGSAVGLSPLLGWVGTYFEGGHVAVFSLLFFARIRGMIQHIGIVACSAEGAALCYRTICTEGERFLGPHGHPEVSMHTPPLAEYVQRIDRGDWQGVGELMLASANKLAAMGANFLICPDNTIHGSLGRTYFSPPSARHRGAKG